MTQEGCRCPDISIPQNAKFVVDLGISALSARTHFNTYTIRHMFDIVLSFFSNPHNTR